MRQLTLTAASTMALVAAMAVPTLAEEEGQCPQGYQLTTETFWGELRGMDVDRNDDGYACEPEVRVGDRLQPLLDNAQPLDIREG